MWVTSKHNIEYLDRKEGGESMRGDDAAGCIDTWLSMAEHSNAEHFI